MRRLGLGAIVFSAALTLVSAMTAQAATQAAAPSGPAHSELTDDGLILLSSAGMTLYFNGADANTPGKSQCADTAITSRHDGQGEFGDVPVIRPDLAKSCVQQWPPYLADANAQASGDYSVITRKDGAKQWAYRGRPLYFSSKDKKAGDRYGSAFSAAGGGGGRNRGFNFATPPLEFPASMKLTQVEDGLALATANGRPVYTTKGHRADACQGCEELFQPISAPAMVELSGDWSVVDAGSGRKQYAYKGKPLYAAPLSQGDLEITELGGWEPVLFRKTAGRPADIEKRLSLLGEVYTDKAGRTLYTFTCGGCDEPGSPAGYWVAVCGVAADCAKRWHPYLAPASARGAGDWSVIDIAYPMFSDPRGVTGGADLPHVKAWAYRGKALYTYHEDKRPGDVWGNRINGEGAQFTAMAVPGRGLTEN